MPVPRAETHNDAEECCRRAGRTVSRLTSATVGDSSLCNCRSFLSLALAVSVAINAFTSGFWKHCCKPPGDTEVREKVGPTESYWRIISGTKVLILILVVLT
jgi:hypothetical protein